MHFNIGDVMRLEYKWPHQAMKEDGNKARPCVVFQDAGGRFFVSPMSTVPPDGKAAPYAIPISAALQRQMNVTDGKPSWVYAHHANLVEPPNPAIRKARPDSWTHGRVPQSLLRSMTEKREAAIAAQAMKVANIRRDATLDRYRSSSVERLTPGQPGNNAARAEEIRQKAMSRAKRSATTPSARAAGINR